jgi:multidrug efflux system outer membrane protein
MLAASMLACAVLSGCAVGPDYKRPKLPAADSFRGQAAQQDSATLADLPWWEVFQDDALKGLINEALRNNNDVLIAAARVEQYRALLGVAKGDFYPWLDYSVSGFGGKNALQQGIMPGTGTGGSFGANINLSWELDIWGRIRRSTEQAKAQLLSTEWGRRGTVLSLVSQVAQAYLELRELDMELEIAFKAVAAYSDTYELFYRKVTGGATSRLDTATAGAALEQAKAYIPYVENQIFQKENQINLLLGRPPQPISRGSALTAQSIPPSTPAGLPSSLLERRPDIIGAEFDLRAANAAIGQAKANFFPKLSITGMFGAGSSDLQTFMMQWAAGGALQGPMFHGFKVYDNYAAVKAQWEQSKQSYVKTVLTAFKDVSNALTAQQKLEIIKQHQTKQVEQCREAVRLSTLRYIGGLAQYYEVVQSLQQLFPAEYTLAQTERDRVLAVVNLYKALGGGWSTPQSSQDGKKKDDVMLPLPLLPEKPQPAAAPAPGDARVQ